MRSLIPIATLSIALLATHARAALTTLTQFDPSQTSGLCGIAADGASGSVWVYGCSAANIQSYSGSGTLLSSVPRPGESANDVDVEIAPVALMIGNTAVSAGTILFINGESGPAEIYAVDGGSGVVLATLITSFGASHVVGGAYHPSRGTFFLVQDRVPGGASANLVAEVDPVTGGVLNSFQTTTFFDVNFGDIDVCGASGNLFLVSSLEARVAEVTPEGGFLQYHDLPAGVSSLSGIGHDQETGTTWVGGTGGNAWLLGGLPCEATSSVPHAEPQAVFPAARPNPARGPVTIRYALPAESPVEISVYDAAGRRIYTRDDGLKPAGWHETVWHGTDNAGSRVSPGIYFYTVRDGSAETVGRVVILEE